MKKILINSSKYASQYVALKSATDTKIVGAGNTPQKALDEARTKGVKNPFLFYVPDKDLVHIYNVS